jgi:regulatory protein
VDADLAESWSAFFYLDLLVVMTIQRPKISLKARALKYLSLREHSRVELERKLMRYAQEGDDVSALLDTLEAAKYLSAERFSESLAHRRAERFGNQRILAELQSHDLPDAAIAQVKDELKHSEAERATSLLHRKFTSAPVDINERAKHMRFLQQRGFSSRAIQEAMRAPREGEGG